MRTIKLGEWKEQIGGYRAFVPAEFPPKEGWQFSDRLVKLHSDAMWHLGKLDERTRRLPDVDYFITMFMRKDAEQSSQIEGTKATLSDAIEAEARTSTEIPEDVDDILHYVQALKYGLDRLQTLPLSLRLIRELHRELLEGARVTQFADPGEFRKSQNRIGGTSYADAYYVPPPPSELERVLSDFEKFIHARDEMLPLFKAGILHAQFETIHPFLDGNGRTGRLLVSLYISHIGLLEKPLNLLWGYFHKYRSEYYDRLNLYHDGFVEAWLDFFLQGVVQTSAKATHVATEIADIREQDLGKMARLGKTSAESGGKVLRQLFTLPIVNVSTIRNWTGFSQPGAQRLIDRLVSLGILELKEKGRKYGRSYIYRRYVDAFSAD